MAKWLLFIKDHITLLLAVSSAYLYICTYQYEKGYLREFEIADEYLALDLNTILKDATQVIGVIVTVVFIYQILLRPLRGFIRRSTKYEEVIRIIIRLITALALCKIFLPISSEILFGGLLISIGIIITVFIYVLFKASPRRIKKTLKENTSEAISQVQDKTVGGFDAYYWVIFIMAMPLFICSYLGQGEAYRKTEFDVIQDSMQCVVIRKYGEQVLCKNLDSNGIAGSKTIIYKLSISKPLIMTQEALGSISSTHLLLEPSSLKN